MFQICDVKFLIEAVGIMSWWEYCWSIGLEIDFSHAWCTPHCVHCQFLSGDGKFLLEGVGTELVQIPLINGIVDSFVRHALCALSVIFRDNLSWNFDLVQILFIIWIRQVSVHVCNRKIQKVTNVLDQLVLRWVCSALSKELNTYQIKWATQMKFLSWWKFVAWGSWNV